MWEPANKAALPSPGDFMHAKKAIDELEDALKDAIVALEAARLKVLALTKDLEERKAWLAPVRKLPSEVLSQIFIFGSEMEHLAPLTITEVCRRWRSVILATPRAWSLIYANAPEHELHLEQYISTFVERSDPCLLHIWIRDDFDHDEDGEDSEYEQLVDILLPLLRPSLSRIQCLSIGIWQLGTLDQESMPSLERLRITDLARDIAPFFVNRDQFPRLQSIQSIGCSWGDSLSLTSFPPLQELAIQINLLSTWIDVVKHCSRTLKSLILTGHLKWTNRFTIRLPRLQSLALTEWLETAEPEEWPISMVTPRLISYEEFSQASGASRLRHGDVKSVTHLRTSHVPDLAPYIRLRVLQLSPSSWSTYDVASKLVEQLEQNSKINKCPALETVVFCLSDSSEEDPEPGPIQNIIIEKTRKARPGLEVLFTQRLSPMPGSIEESACGLGMPCSDYTE